MNEQTKTAIIAAAKEAGRIALFAALTALIGYGNQKLTGLDPSSLYVLIGTLLLKALDKYIHENENIPATGLVPF